MNNFILSTFLFMGLAAAQAAGPVRVAGHEYPARVSEHGLNWTLRGTHHFRYRRIFSVFTAALYEEAQSGGRRLHFTYTRDISGDDLRKQAMEYLTSTQSKEHLKKYAAPLEAIQASYRDVSDGDAYTLSAAPGDGTRLSLNGEEVFFHEDAEFGAWYMQIWLGDPPLSTALKNALTRGES